MGIPGKIITRIRGNFRRFRISIRKKIRKDRLKFRRWRLKNKHQIKELRDWTSNVFLYGAMINMPATWIFSRPFTVLTVVGWGVLFYLAKVELPFIIRSCQIRK